MTKIKAKLMGFAFFSKFHEEANVTITYLTYLFRKIIFDFVIID